MDEKKDKAYKLVEDKHNRSYTALTPLFKRFNKVEDDYFGYLKPSENSSQSNVYDPVVLEVVEHTASHLFAQLPKGTFTPGAYDSPIEAEIANEIVQYQIEKHEQMMRKKLLIAGKTAYLFGYAFGITYWRYERVFDKALNQWTTVWDDPCLEIPPIYDCWFDIDASNSWSFTFFGFDEYKTLKELKKENVLFQGKRRYDNLNKLQDLISEGYGDSTNQYRDNASNRRGMKVDKTDGGNRILVRHYFDKDRWITTLPGYGLTIEDRENPYPFDLPVSILIDQDFPNLPIGIGEVEPIQKLAKATNQFLNMRFDNVGNILEPPIKSTQNNLKHSSTWLFKRNHIWVTDGMNDVEPMTFPDVTGATFQNTMNYIQTTILQRTGRADLRANQNMEDKTATEVEALVGEQNARLNYKGLNTDDFITDIYIKFLRLDQVYLSKERQILILGEDRVAKLQEMYGVAEDAVDEEGTPLEPKIKTKAGQSWLTVNPEDIRGMFNFRIETGSTRSVNKANQVAAMREAIRLANELRESLAAEGFTIDLRPLVESLFKDLGVKNVDKLFRELPPPQPAQEGGGDDLAILNQLLAQDGGSQQEILQGSPAEAAAVNQGEASELI